jgi:hypothetical protein
MGYSGGHKVTKIVITQIVQKIHCKVYTMKVHYRGQYAGEDIVHYHNNVYSDIRNYANKAELESELKRIHGNDIEIKYDVKDPQ